MRYSLIVVSGLLLGCTPSKPGNDGGAHDLAMRPDLASPPDLNAGPPDLNPGPPDLMCPSYTPGGGGGMGRPEALLPGGMYSIEGVSFTVAPFFLDVFEVTVQGYRDCVGDGTCSKPQTGGFCNWSDNPSSKENHPVNCVTWDQATAFCQWAGRRLPTEEEWEYAAAGPAHSKYPWGNDDPMKGTQACWYQFQNHDPMAQPLGTCPEGSFSTTLLGAPDCHGVADLAGNVWEWTGSEYKEPFVHPVATCKDACSIRGGSWDSYDPANLGTAFRSYNHGPTFADVFIGFRCARTK